MSYVYCIGARVGCGVKIGVTLSLRDRLTALQTGSFDKLHILGHIKGGRNEEAALHWLFASLRVRDEWFVDKDGTITSWFTNRAADESVSDARVFGKCPHKQKAERPHKTSAPQDPLTKAADIRSLVISSGGMLNTSTRKLAATLMVSHGTARNSLNAALASGAIIAEKTKTGTTLMLPT